MFSPNKNWCCILYTPHCHHCLSSLPNNCLPKFLKRKILDFTLTRSQQYKLSISGLIYLQNNLPDSLVRNHRLKMLCHLQNHKSIVHICLLCIHRRLFLLGLWNNSIWSIACTVADNSLT